MPPYFFFRTSFPEGTSSLPLRDIPPERQLKPDTKTYYFFTNHRVIPKQTIKNSKQQHVNLL